MKKECYIKNAPVFTSSNKLIEDVYNLAVKNLLDINTVDCPSERYNKTGLLNEELGLMIRAGGNYDTPWTRDASINSWNAASIMEPEVAENTLWAVCEKTSDGKLVLQMDEQCWDKMIWAVGAWNHYVVTGDKEFLKNAYEVVETTLSYLEKSNYNGEYGLFTGGSFFNDGIAGYPKDLHEEGNESSFVGHHHPTDFIMTLSTNCIYYKSYAAANRMAEIFGENEKAEEFAKKAEAVKSAINTHMWNEERGSYDYIVYPDGRKDNSQEACGISFAILFGVADDEKAEKILNNAEISERGLVSICPPFEGLFSKEHPGRHNNLIWPFINGFFITAASKYKKLDIVKEEIENIAKLVKNSEDEFYEIYNPYTGEIDGGWQAGIHWDSCHDQTWSASSYLRAIVHGLCGVSVCEKGVSVKPCVPEGWSEIKLTNVKMRNLTLNLEIEGHGIEVKTVTINGENVDKAFVSFDKNGTFDIKITL